MRFTILSLILFISLSGFSQNVVAFREAPLNGSAQYTLTGTAYIEELANGSFQFRLSSNYSTNSGPDVHIYLTNNSSFSTPINVNGALFVEDIGTEAGPNQPGISHFSGAYTKALPNLNSLSDFNHVVFTCFRFGTLHWGNGSFGPVTTTCATSFATVTTNACASYTAPSGAIYTQSGMFSDTIPNAAGCDSVITLDLTIDNVNTGITSVGTTLSSSDPNATYQWIDCNNNNAPIQGETNQDFTAAVSGSYAVIVTNGTCSDTSACFNTTVTGIEASSFGSEFRLYPNPSHGTTVLDLGQVSGSDPVEITITDMVGKVVYTLKENYDSRINLAVDNLETGVYFVAVGSNRDRKVMRLVKL